MKKIVLDFTGAKTWADIYAVLKKSFAFPYDGGNNLDALYDAMSYTWHENICIMIKGLDRVSTEWQPYMKEILAVFRDVHEETPNVIFQIIPSATSK